MDLKVVDFIGSDTAIAPSRGNLMHDFIKENVSKQEVVNLDFTGMDLMTTAFLNAAIGKLYSEFSSEILSKYLKIKYISQSDAVLLKKVVETAKSYFASPDDFEKHINSKLNG
jgi:hypothetical protein